jgi:hypothetical protein
MVHVRCEAERKDIQPVVKIGTELPLFHHVPQVLVGSRDYAHVDVESMAVT